METALDLSTRRLLVRTTTVDGAPGSAPVVNGVDYLEVTNIVEPDPSDDRSVIEVKFIHPLEGDGAAIATPSPLTAEMVTIEGGDRVRGVTVTAVAVIDGDTLSVDVDRIGDHSTYVLTINNGPGWLDPALAEVPFSFLVECPTRFDCLGVATEATAAVTPPPIDYLARDYESFRQLMLDRMSATVPTWTERNPADLGVAIVETLAYLGDHLAYEQDVVATEAYLSRARFRTSVARHLRLVDYHLDPGRNALVWIALDVTAELRLGRGARFWTHVDGQPAVSTDQELLSDALDKGVPIFESITGSTHRPAHNQIEFHTWGGALEAIGAGATAATLRNPLGVLRLQPGDFVLIEQTAHPVTRAAEGADASRRQVVRLTSVEARVDPLDRTVANAPLDLLTVSWSREDELSFELPLGSGLAAANANLVLADHGATMRRAERLPVVPDEPHTARYRPTLGNDHVTHSAAVFAESDGVADAATLGALNAGTFGRSVARLLSEAGIVVVVPEVRHVGPDRWVISDAATLVTVDRDGDVLRLQAGPASARSLGGRPSDSDTLKLGASDRRASDRGDSIRAYPAIRLYDVDPTAATPDHIAGSPGEWLAADDLVRASADDQLFAVEVESGGSAALRFGDDETGRRPNAGTTFDAVYRVGAGVAGNIGRDTIRHCVVSLGPSAGTTDSQTIFDGPASAILRVRNPLAAVGGAEPESIQAARIRAPEVFERQLRAVTPDDYVARLESHPLVQRSVVSRQWTGSWPTLFCTVDLIDGIDLSPRTEAVLRQWIEPRRTMGHDIEIDEPEFVPVEVALCVGVDGSAHRALVARDLAARLSSASGGLFHPDRMTFGQRLHLSDLSTEVQQIAGVREVDVRIFRRLGSTDTTAVDRGYIDVTGREIAVLDNDPNHPERGSLTFTIEGGR